MLPNTDNSGRRISSVSDNSRTASSSRQHTTRRVTGKTAAVAAAAAASTMLLLVFVQTSLLVGVLRAPAGAVAESSSYHRAKTYMAEISAPLPNIHDEDDGDNEDDDDEDDDEDDESSTFGDDDDYDPSYRDVVMQKYDPSMWI